MTKLLSKAFEKAQDLPEGIQDEIAAILLADIEGELKWDDTLKKSNEKLEKMPSKVLDNFRAGRTQEKGFDEV